MSSYLERHRVVCDPFGQGSGANGLALMMPLTNGFQFPWREGNKVLMRRTLYPTPSAWGYCGVATPAKTQIKSYAGYSHQANQAYQYAAAALLGNGMISRATPPVRLDFDGSKVLITPGLPAWPRNVTATPIAAGKFLVTWEYDPFGQAAYPKDFQVFTGAAPVGVVYTTPIADSITGLTAIPYEANRRVYSFTSPAYTPHLRPRSFAVRARNVNGVAEKNTNATAVQLSRLDSPTPAAAAALIHVSQHSRSSG